MIEPRDGFEKRPVEKTPADLMREFRLRMLTASPSQFAIEPTPEHPTVYGLMMDWPLNDEVVATIVAFSDGNASLYTTSSFGIVGGFAHESVQSAARQLLTAADGYYAEATPVESFPYPEVDRVNFYLLGFEGVRMLAGDLEKISAGGDLLSKLFLLAQGVLTALRIVSESGQP